MNDNKTRTETRGRPKTLRQAVSWALVLSSMISTPVLSAQTDISSSPITSTSERSCFNASNRRRISPNTCPA